MGELSEFVKDVKVTFSRFYNRRHNRIGTLWADRFKSLIVQDGSTLINCLSYIGLNPVRTGIVERSEEYRWCSLAYHLQTGNRDNFLSMDFGLREFGVMREERLRRYRRHVFKAGGIKRSDGKSTVIIDEKIVEKERKADFKISRIHRFRCRTHWFTDSGIIGSREFVSRNYKRFKHHFNSKREKKPKRIKGLDGVYSLKRLSTA